MSIAVLKELTGQKMSCTKGMRRNLSGQASLCVYMNLILVKEHGLFYIIIHCTVELFWYVFLYDHTPAHSLFCLRMSELHIFTMQNILLLNIIMQDSKE